MPVFGPAAELVAWRVPKSETFVVEKKDPKPLTPRPASSNETNAGHGRAGQLAVLKQGPPVDGSVRPWDRAAGAEQSGGGSSGNSMCHGSFYWHDQRKEVFGNYLEYLKYYCRFFSSPIPYSFLFYIIIRRTLKIINVRL